ncbi:hypothetical protein TIFTF001_022291 [Ficus carica]|uniref:Uncharacterized protein n=1 Tax=Ficus carica TaxID=3494 RepID=A0AA88AHJ2_FICCA|nr:hypothetical protein TIFTF001_022291 [Ficus carica]
MVRVMKRIKKLEMGISRKRELACLSLLLLLMLLLHLESNACFAEGYIGKSTGRFRRSAISSKSHELSRVKSQTQVGFKDGDEVFGVEKRKVYTGPNPLHNR